MRAQDLRRKIVQYAESGNSWDDIIAFLVAVIVAKPKEASPDNPSCELVMTQAGLRATFPKLEAIELLCELNGWFAGGARLDDLDARTESRVRASAKNPHDDPFITSYKIKY
jgi:hypothetical protein